MCVRNEMGRLPFALSYYRDLGVGQFLIVDNDSTDGTRDYLKAQPDVRLWHTKASYRDSRFGLDWMNWFAIFLWHVLLHLCPNVIGNCNSVAI